MKAGFVVKTWQLTRYLVIGTLLSPGFFTVLLANRVLHNLIRKFFELANSFLRDLKIFLLFFFIFAFKN